MLSHYAFAVDLSKGQENVPVSIEGDVNPVFQVIIIIIIISPNHVDSAAIYILEVNSAFLKVRVNNDA